jgi:hypothetical protein
MRDGLSRQGDMNEARRHAVRVISNVPEALVSELSGLAEDEKKAFEKMPPVLQYGSSGDESTQAHSVLEEAVNAISLQAFELAELAKKSQ